MGIINECTLRDEVYCLQTALNEADSINQALSLENQRLSKENDYLKKELSKILRMLGRKFRLLKSTNS